MCEYLQKFQEKDNNDPCSFPNLKRKEAANNGCNCWRCKRARKCADYYLKNRRQVQKVAYKYIRNNKEKYLKIRKDYIKENKVQYKKPQKLYFKKEVCEKLVKALRSGKYQQGQIFLRQNCFFCALGVLCDLYEKETKDKIWNGETYIGRYKYIPSKVRKWAGIRQENIFVVSNGRRRALTSLNDANMTFKDIAEFLEKTYLEKL